MQAFEQDITRPQRVREFTSQALSNMAWSFATLRWYPEKVLEAISGELLRRAHFLSVQVCQNFRNHHTHDLTHHEYFQ